MMLNKNFQFGSNLFFVLGLFILAVIAGHTCSRLDRLEQTMWGESQAPTIVDSTIEITGNKYDRIETMLALRPSIMPLVQRVFEDEVIIHAEYEEVKATYDALRERERTERSIDAAKADLQKALKQKDEG